MAGMVERSCPHAITSVRNGTQVQSSRLFPQPSTLFFQIERFSAWRAKYQLCTLNRNCAVAFNAGNLVAVAKFRLLAKQHGLTDVSLQGRHIRFSPMPLPDSKQLRLKRLYPEAVYKPVTEQISITRPNTRRVGGEPMRDIQLLEWCAELITTLLDAPKSAAARA